MHKFIEWNTFQFKQTSGKEKIACPTCQADKNRKGDKSISINHVEGFGKCHRCESLTFREDETKKIKMKDYKLPIQTWRNHTELSDNMVKYIEDTRKINQHTLNALNITEEKYYQPMTKKDTNNIVFNYFEKDVLVNKKYRDSQKNFTQSAGTKSIFYNINSVIGQNEVWITEGEFDVLALYQVGIKNAISVPNGANDNDDVWENAKEYLKDVKKFIIAVDMDEKGKSLRDKISQRLGRFRCEFVEWKNKDANDDLIEGVLDSSIKNRKRFPVSGTFNVTDLKGGILDLYENGLPDTIKPKGYYFKEFSETFSLMRGQLTVGTGIPSHGKSNFTDWMVLNLIKDYNMKASWFSPEHSPMSLYQTNLMEKVIGRNFWQDTETSAGTAPRITKAEIDQFEQWANEKIYLTGAEGTQLPTWDWLLDKFKEQMYSFGIDIFVIDAFNKVLLPKGNKIDMINEVLTKLTHFAQSNNVMIILVAHPTKMQKNEDGTSAIPDLYSVSGSADFRNQTHNGFTIHRTWADEETGVENTTSFYNQKTKFNFQGKIGGRVDFNYCLTNGRYYEKNTEEPFFNLIDSKETDAQFEQEKKIVPQIDVNDAFDLDNNPFDEIDF